MNKILLVGKREYLKVVRTPTFWISTLFFPIFIAVVSVISGYSATVSEEKFEKQASEAKSILILDETGYIKDEFIQAPYMEVGSEQEGIDSVKQGKSDAFIYYQADLKDSKDVKIYSKYNGLIGNATYNNTAEQLIKQSILSDITDSNKLQIYNSSFNIQVTSFENGQQKEVDFTDFIVPGVSVILYFILVFFASSFMLMSVSEEKENRMIETILSIMKPRDLIWGKIIGQIGIVMTQAFILFGLGSATLFFARPKLPFDLNLSNIDISIFQILLAIFFIICGFLIMVNIMVGVGAAVPTYKDAQSLSSIFIILSILPIYFVTLIVTEPSGLIARIASYFPFTAPLILLFRSAMGELPAWEIGVSMVVVLIYTVIAFIFSFKLFEIGALETSRKISLKSLFS